MKPKNLAVAFVQSTLVWENPKENLLLFEAKINGIQKPFDLLVLPEMFTTGFTMNVSSNSLQDQKNSLLWMKKIASEKEACVLGSIIYRENEAYYNRLWVVFPSGETLYYDKKHLFTLAKEHENYTAGTTKLLFEYKGWRISPLVCYDLRFPVWARNTENYDLLLYVANWPKVRVEAWDTLLKARAIENMSYCLGVNRSGEDGKGFEYSGNSAMYDMLGKQISSSNNQLNEFTEVVTLSYDSLHNLREKLGFLKDADAFKLS